MTGDETKPIDVQQATRLREAMVAVSRRARRQRPAHGLTMTQVALLGDLERHGASSVVDLAERAQVKVQSLTLSLNRLEELELITRRPDSTDRRRVMVELTAIAGPLLEEDRRQRDEWLAAAMAGLSETERGLLMLCIPILSHLADHPDRTDPVRRQG
ncbi:MarR family transcriptional regulator [Williamsia sp.]|uniref:MarR family transcriptional regulator n=1 Tax=Williamsia sp. TaxID=1872085 RepID=UPI002F928B02